MADLVSLFSQGMKVSIAGKEYDCRPLKLKDFSDIATRVKAKKQEDLKAVMGILPTGPERSAFVKESLLPVKDSDVFQYISTFDGIMYTFWLLVRNDAEFKTFESFQSAVTIEDVKSIQTTITDMLGGGKKNFDKAQEVSQSVGQQPAPDSVNITDGL